MTVQPSPPTLIDLPQGRRAPQSVEAEAAVLGAMLLDVSAIGRAIESNLREEDFFVPAHRAIFRSVLRLYDRRQAVDPVTLKDELRRSGDLERAGGDAYLSEVIASVPTIANVEYHARIVLDNSIKRRLISVGTQIVGDAYERPEEADTLLDQAEKRIFEIAERRLREGFVPINQLLVRTIELVESLSQNPDRVTGVPSDFKDLDLLTTGFQLSDLIIVAGRPAMGKCLAFDSEIVLADGSVATIEDVYCRGAAQLLTLGDDWKLRTAEVSAFVDDGIKPVSRVTTRLGRSVETTLTHPFLTISGWKRLSELTSGDRIAVPRRLDVFGNEMLENSEVEHLADMAGDGAQTARRIPRRLSRTISARAGSTLRIAQVIGVGPSSVAGTDEPSSVPDPHEDRVLAQRSERPSTLPEIVFRLSKPQVALFLNRLFARAGWVRVLASSQVQLGCSTVGKRLAEQVQHLLLRFGVVSTLRKGSGKYDRNRQGLWQLDIADLDSIKTFIEEVGIRGKEEILALLHQSVTAAREPVEGHAILVEEVGAADGASPLVLEGDVYWDEIVSIEPAGRKQVYDLTIPGTHNFVANDICVHNTSFALNIAQNASIRHDVPVAIFSLEMSKDQLVQRILCSEARVDAQKMRTGHLSPRDEWQRIVRACDRLQNAKIYIDDTPALGILEMRAKARRLKAEVDLGLILVDYLQLMEVGMGVSRAENRQQEISTISRSLKGLAKELNVPVIALSQLSRAPEQRADHRPTLSDLRECVTGDTLVVLTDGTRVPIGELVGTRPSVYAMAANGRIVRAAADRVWLVGRRPIFELRLASGRIIRATAQHRVFTGDGWKVLADIQPSDRVAIARFVSEPMECEEWPNRRLILLGQLIGDGSYLSNQPLRYTTSSEENSLAVTDAAREEFGSIVRRYTGRGRWHQLLLSGNGNRWRPARVNKWLRELDIFNQRSYEKRVPRSVFRLRNEQIGLLLRHLWATDGSIHVRNAGSRGSPGVYFSTCSPGLAADVSALLLRLGIVARTHRVVQIDYRPWFMVRVSGVENQGRFLAAVGAFGPRCEPAERLALLLKGGKGNTNVDTLPQEVFTRVKAVMKAKGITQRRMAHIRGTAYGGTSHFSFAPSRAIAAGYAEILDDQWLREMAANDLFWDRVVNVMPCGEDDVYDLTVPGVASWLADGIVSHNSGALEQDSDLVLFLYRDEIYNPTSDKSQGLAEVIVGKHRNGPTGSVTLRFTKEFTRFDNYTPRAEPF